LSTLILFAETDTVDTAIANKANVNMKVVEDKDAIIVNINCYYCFVLYVCGYVML
jgi:hypothetical protein